MALDDPMVWVLIVGLAILLFGSNKIPELARSLGVARREFDAASKGLVNTINSEISVPASTAPSPRVVKQPIAASPVPPASEPQLADNDPLLLAARNEGIDTRGKSRSQIAAELATKVRD
jgi:TatA/E family protein of Tat protein translocase